MAATISDAEILFSQLLHQVFNLKMLSYPKIFWLSYTDVVVQVQQKPSGFLVSCTALHDHRLCSRLPGPM